FHVTGVQTCALPIWLADGDLSAVVAFDSSGSSSADLVNRSPNQIVIGARTNTGSEQSSDITVAICKVFTGVISDADAITEFRYRDRKSGVQGRSADL